MHAEGERWVAAGQEVRMISAYNVSHSSVPACLTNAGKGGGLYLVTAFFEAPIYCRHSLTPLLISAALMESFLRKQQL